MDTKTVKARTSPAFSVQRGFVPAALKSAPKVGRLPYVLHGRNCGPTVDMAFLYRNESTAESIAVRVSPTADGSYELIGTGVNTTDERLSDLLKAIQRTMAFMVEQNPEVGR